MTATHRTKVFLTSDLAVEFTVFDHGTSEVPESAWLEFTAAYRRGHGCDVPGDGTLTGYVISEAWGWDKTFTDGTVVIGDDGDALALEEEPAGPEGCRVVFWDEGSVYDTGLRVWADEAAIITRLLKDRP